MYVWITEIHVAFLVWSAILVVAVYAGVNSGLPEFRDVAKVTVSVLNEKKYSTWPSCSFRFEDWNLMTES